MTIRHFAFALIAALSSAGSWLATAAEAVAHATMVWLEVAFPAREPALAFATTPDTARLLGLPQTRSFHARRLARVGDRRARAPDSVAFVTS